MLRTLAILFLFCVTQLAVAQDSLSFKKHSGGSPPKNQNFFGSTKVDSLNPSSNVFNHKLDSSKKSLTHKIDSLERLKLPTTKYKHQLDSISRINPLRSVNQQEAKLSSAEQKATGVVTSTEKKITQKLNLLAQDADHSIPSTSLPGGASSGVTLPNSQIPSMPSLPNESIPSTSLPTNPLSSATNSLTQNPISSDVQKEMSGVNGLPQKGISDLTNNNELGGIKKDLGETNQITRQAEGYGKDLKGVINGDSASRQRMAQKLETQAKNEVTKAGGLNSITSENQTLDQYKKLASTAENPETMEKEGLSQVKKQAVNHFAGKEQILQNAMQEVSKLKQKYHSLNGLNNIPKRVPNAMHGKPLIERLVPGLTFQILSTGRMSTADINPLLGYRFTKRFTAGAGWNSRVGVHHFNIYTHQNFYGPRIFTDYRVKGGLSFRAELETMNTFIPPNQVYIFGDRPRQWVWNSYVGIKKDYKLFKYLKGNAQMLYNANSLFEKHHINLYGQPISARIGFEFPMTKKRKASARHQP